MFEVIDVSGDPKKTTQKCRKIYVVKNNGQHLGDIYGSRILGYEPYEEPETFHFGLSLMRYLHFDVERENFTSIEEAKQAVLDRLKNRGEV